MKHACLLFTILFLLTATACSTTSTTTSSRRPPAASQRACNARPSGPYALPDPHCTPGAVDTRVTQANIHTTICQPGYTRKVRPPSSVTGPEKQASMQAYGDSGSPSSYEYDHLISLELGGAPNDQRNLWPEPGKSPNPKDKLENRLHEQVCAGGLPLVSAQTEIASDWVAAYHHEFG